MISYINYREVILTQIIHYLVAILASYITIVGGANGHFRSNPPPAMGLCLAIMFGIGYRDL